jgi:hypothetical protein
MINAFVFNDFALNSAEIALNTSPHLMRQNWTEIKLFKTLFFLEISLSHKLFNQMKVKIVFLGYVQRPDVDSFYKNSTFQIFLYEPKRPYPLHTALLIVTWRAYRIMSLVYCYGGYVWRVLIDMDGELSMRWGCINEAVQIFVPPVGPDFSPVMNEGSSAVVRRISISQANG